MLGSSQDCQIPFLSPLSLYIHIPFCGTRCTYCAFNTYVNVDDQIPAYVAAMCNELYWLGQVTTQPLHTIYFGGGTPSMLTPDQVALVIQTCNNAFNLLSSTEITLEVNPGSIDGSYFPQILEAGVNRLSFGMQSAHTNELRLFARQHDVDAVIHNFQTARRAGFDNISLDLIFGVPHQTLEMWRETLRTALALHPDHLSMYSLILENGTSMHKWVNRGWLPQPDDDLAADMYELADQMACDAGLPQYELSNWARPGAGCLHNLQYWRNEPYLGVGAGAHGYAANVRYEVIRPIQRYIELAQSQDRALDYPITASVEHSEPIDEAGAMAEHMMTGLRLVNEGISRSAFEQRFGTAIEAVYGTEIAELIQNGLLVQNGDKLQLTPRARLLSNQVFMRFMRD
jgi:oxygen-independent coproporphyrinogen III oxidase